MSCCSPGWGSRDFWSLYQVSIFFPVLGTYLSPATSVCSPVREPLTCHFSVVIHKCVSLSVALKRREARIAPPPGPPPRWGRGRMAIGPGRGGLAPLPGPERLLPRSHQYQLLLPDVTCPVAPRVRRNRHRISSRFHHPGLTGRVFPAEPATHSIGKSLVVARSR